MQYNTSRFLSTLFYYYKSNELFLLLTQIKYQSYKLKWEQIGIKWNINGLTVNTVAFSFIILL